jgi:hypothetical protein
MDLRRKRVTLVVILILLAVGIVVPLANFLNTPTSELTVELTKLGQIDLGDRTANVKVQGDVAYIIDQSEPTPKGLVLINVSDPMNPIELSSYHDGGMPRELDVVENIVYVTDAFQGLEIIDVSDTANPQKIGEYIGSGEIYDIQVFGDLAYLADWNNGMVILNVSDPTSPEFLSDYSILGACHHLHVVDDFAYVIDHRDYNTGFKILNISDPLDPELVGNYMPDDEDLWNPFVVENYMYVGNHATDGGELQILDLSDPTNITRVGMYDDVWSNLFSVFVENQIAYIADATRGLVIVDVRNPSNPVFLADFSDDSGAIGLDVVDDLVYLANIDGGLEIIQVSGLDSLS